MGFSQLFTGVVTIIGTIGFMLSVNIWTTLVVVLVTPLSILVARFIAKKTFAMFRLQSETRGRQTAFINEMITNQRSCTHTDTKTRTWRNSTPSTKSCAATH